MYILSIFFYSSNISFSSSGYPSLIEAYIEDNLPYDVNTYAFLTWDHWKVAGMANLPKYRVEDGWEEDGRPHRDQGKNYIERSLGKAPFKAKIHIILTFMNINFSSIFIYFIYLSIKT